MDDRLATGLFHGGFQQRLIPVRAFVQIRKGDYGYSVDGFILCFRDDGLHTAVVFDRFHGHRFGGRLFWYPLGEEGSFFRIVMGMGDYRSVADLGFLCSCLVWMFSHKLFNYGNIIIFR